MSKGPGKIERAVVDLVASDRDNAFTVENACWSIYNLHRELVTKKHRVAVIRAARAGIARGANLGLMGWGGRGRAVVFYTPDNLTSYGIASIKSHSPRLADHDAWPRQRLAETDYQENMAPDGAWWCSVELFKAKRDGDGERAAEIEAKIEQQRKAAEMKFAAMMRGFGR